MHHKDAKRSCVALCSTEHGRRSPAGCSCGGRSAGAEWPDHRGTLGAAGAPRPALSLTLAHWQTDSLSPKRTKWFSLDRLALVAVGVAIGLIKPVVLGAQRWGTLDSRVSIQGGANRFERYASGSASGTCNVSFDQPEDCRANGMFSSANAALCTQSLQLFVRFFADTAVALQKSRSGSWALQT